MMIGRRHFKLLTYLLILFTLSTLNVKCVLSSLLNEIDCLAKILSRYRDIYSCPWDITSVCSPENLTCQEVESDCGIQDPGVTNVSVIVYLSMIPFIEDHKVIQTTWCRCKNVAFVCNLTSNIPVFSPENAQCLSTMVGHTAQATTLCQTANIDACFEDSGTPFGQIIGAALGGVGFTLIVIGISFFLLRKFRNINSSDKVPMEMATQNPAYGSQSDMAPLQHNNLRTNTMSNTEYYSSINDNSVKVQQKVSHVRPIVRYENDPQQHQVENDHEIYGHLNESKPKDNNDDYDHASPVPVNRLPTSTEYDVLKHSKSDNEYTEVIGDGFQQFS